MKNTYTGSCHCGAVRFEADLDLSAGSGKCNCSICAKTRSWGILVKPEDFRAINGEESLSNYRFGDAMHHLFCKNCGVRPYGKGFLDFMGGDFFFVNLSCVDNITPEELARIPVRYSDGLNNNWESAPEVVGYL